MSHQFEIRLQGMLLPDGEIALADLAAIASRLQELSTRVSRWVADIEGAGRSPKLVEDVAVLRLVATHAGSTVLQFSSGVPDLLDLDTTYEQEVAERFWGIVAAIGTDAPPPDAPATLRQSAIGLLDALEHAAPRIVVARPDGARIEFSPVERDRSVWHASDSAPDLEPVTLVGRIEAVDLRTHRFRLVDDAGNRLPLTEVQDAEHVARLVATRASVTGRPLRDPRGRMTGIDKPSLAAVTLPDELDPRDVEPSWSLPPGYTGPDPDDGIELDEDEWAAFLSAIG